MLLYRITLVRGQPINVEIALNQNLLPRLALPDNRCNLSQGVVADDFLFLIIVHKWQMDRYCEQVSLLCDEVSAAARAHTGGVLVVRVDNGSQSSGTIWKVSVSDGVVCILCPPSLVVVLEARISFDEGGKAEQADHSGEPVATHANG